MQQQSSARQRELERTYNSRKGHVPQISISDDTHHVTEAIGSYYDDSPTDETMNGPKRDQRPYSFLPGAHGERIDTPSRRNGGFFGDGSSPPRTPLASTVPNERMPNNGGESGLSSPKSALSRMGSENNPSPPALSRQTSSETASQHFPLNDIDYESSPAAVAQELSNLQAIRRMSMNVDAADPDLPSFGPSSLAPRPGGDDDDTSRLFWVPAHLHPELAPKEFKTFIEDKVDLIRRRSGDGDSLSPDGLERTGSTSSAGSSIRRKKSMLSHQIDTRGEYQDGAERLERKRSQGMSVGGEAKVDLAELERLVEDPSQLVRRMSLDTGRRSSEGDGSDDQDRPILPPVGQSLKRSTRTTYRRGSLRKGERVPFSKRAQNRQADTDNDESPLQSPIGPSEEQPILGLTRVQTEPAPISPQSESGLNFTPRSSSRKATHGLSTSQSSDNLSSQNAADEFAHQSTTSIPPRESEDDFVTTSPQQLSPQKQPQPPQHQHQHHDQQQQSQQSNHEGQNDSVPQMQRPQPRQFHSRIASQGRTTAQLPGYTNTNPLPNIIETLPDGTKVPVGPLADHVEQKFPERRSSHDLPRAFQRGGAHNRPIPGRQNNKSSKTLDDLSSRPTPLPGSGGTSTDALTMVPTFEDQKSSKKDGSRKSSWKWVFGADDDDKKTAKDEAGNAADTASLRSNKSGKSSKLTKSDKTRLDVLQTSIDGGPGSAPGASTEPRGRESLVLDRASIRLDEEREKTSSKASKKAKEKDKDSGNLLSSLFGGKKKTSDTDLKERKRKSDHNRHLSPEPPPRILKPDIDYNWTRFSILEERAIYRMAHIKLANPRRALYSQVLLSNFMYSYLAKVQMMHPQIQIPPAQQKLQQRGSKKSEEPQPAEYSQYQRWQEEQARQEQQHQPSPQSQADSGHDGRQGGYEQGGYANEGYDQNHGYDQTQQYHQQQQQVAPQDEFSYVSDQAYGHDRQRRSEEYDRHAGGYGQYQHQQHQQQQQQQHYVNGGGNSANSGYSVSSGHDYLGYPKDQQPFDQQGLWDDEEKEEMW